MSQLDNFYTTILDNTKPKSAGYIDPRRDFKIYITFTNSNSNLPAELREYVYLYDTNGNETGDISPFVQSVDLPRINADSGSTADNVIANIDTHTTILNSGSKTLTLSIINTGDPIIESFFYPWLREVTSPIWIYDDRPYTKATITIDFTSHSTVMYDFYGCRPTEIETLQASHAPNTILTRGVSITYDLAAVIRSNLAKNEASLREEMETYGVSPDAPMPGHVDANGNPKDPWGEPGHDQFGNPI